MRLKTSQSIGCPGVPGCRTQPTCRSRRPTPSRLRRRSGASHIRCQITCGQRQSGVSKYPGVPSQPQHAHGDFVPTPTRRHRRKAGSGPPAAALIAWIGADARRCSTTAATLSRRHEIDLPPSATVGPARAAVAGLVLICGTVLAATASISEGLLEPREAALRPVVPADLDTQPDQQAPPMRPQQVQPMPVDPPAPTAGGSGGTSVVRQAPQFIPVPPAAEPVDQPVGQITPVVPDRSEPVRREPTRRKHARSGGSIHPDRSVPLGATVEPPVTVKVGGTLNPGVTARSRHC
jgi:hypothetical protein